MSESHRILALDAAGSACSAAVWAHGRVVAQRLVPMARGQSEHLLPMIEEVMAEAGLAYAELDAIAASVGPGGFTGVRIGLAAARGLALACAVPLVGVTNFEALAGAVPEAELAGGRTLAVLLDAKRTEVYAQAFAADRRPLGDPGLIAPEGLDRSLPPGPLLLAGDGVAAARGALAAAGRDLAVSRAGPHAEAAWIARLAAARPLPAADAPAPAPLYLRQPDVTLPRHPRPTNPGPAKPGPSGR